MARFHIRPSVLSGAIEVPPSKSHSLRALLFGALANGTSVIRRCLASPDAAAMVNAVRQIGARVEIDLERITVHGTHGRVQTPEDVIQCGNSGQVLRFIGALTALQNRYAILTGDASIRTNRPIEPLLEGLQQLGAFAVSARLDNTAPILIKGPLLQGQTTLDGADSQPVSGLLIASAFAPHPIAIHVRNPGELPWVGLTLYWFDKLGIAYRNHNFSRYELKGSSSIAPFSCQVPGDFSSAAFPIAAALVTGSELFVKGLDPEDVQGDKKIIDVLLAMGARIEWEGAVLHIHKTSTLKGLTIDVNDLIDAVPILAVIACFAEGTTRIVHASIARTKECDRLHCITHELRKMGAKIEEIDDGLLIESSALCGAHLETYHDHRMVMALSVAAMGATGESSLVGVECVSKSYPGFHDDFRSIGAKIELLV